MKKISLASQPRTDCRVWLNVGRPDSPFVISSWTKAAVFSLRCQCPARCHQRAVVWCAWYTCRTRVFLWWQSCLLLAFRRIWWRSLGYLFFVQPVTAVLWLKIKEDEHPSSGTLRLRQDLVQCFTLLLLILSRCSLCEVPKLLVFHQRVL